MLPFGRRWNTKANWQAFGAVAITSIATGIGTGIGGAVEHRPIWFLWGLLIGLEISILGWLLWSLLTYVIGLYIFKGPETEADYGQALRTFIPFLGGIITFVITVWMLVAGVIAVRQALDFSTWRAIGTCLLGWLVYILLLFLVPGFIIGRAILF